MDNRYKFSFKYHTLKWHTEDQHDKDIHRRKRPCVVVYLKGENKVELIEYFLLDSGADCPIIKQDLAELLGLVLSKKPEKIKTAGKDANVYSSTLNIGLIQKNGYFNLGENVDCYVFEKGKTDVPNIMGREPLFQNFRVVFEEYNEIVYLTYMGKAFKRKIKKK